MLSTALTPVLPMSAIADAIAGHTISGRYTTRTDLPGGYRLALRSRTHGDLSVSLFAPSPAGPKRIVLARFKGVMTGVVPARVLNTAVRCAPSRPDLPDACPDPAVTAKAMTLGEPRIEPGHPGGLVEFGPAQLWLEYGELTVTLGRAGSMRIALEGPWDYQATARLADAMLREASWLHRLDPATVAATVAATLSVPEATVQEDTWHPAAVTVFLPALPGDDELGRAHSRRYGALAAQVKEGQPDWRVQRLISNEAAIVALRITLASADVPPLYGYITEWIPANGYDALGKGSGTFITEYRPRHTTPRD